MWHRIVWKLGRGKWRGGGGGGGDKVVTCSPWGAAIGQGTLVCGNDYEVTEDDLQNYSPVCIFF